MPSQCCGFVGCAHMSTNMANMLAADDALFHMKKFLPDTSEDNVRQCRLSPTLPRHVSAVPKQGMSLNLL